MLRKLKGVLIANGAFSLISGLVLITVAHSIAKLMGIANDQVLVYVGIGLVVFAGTVLYAAFKNPLSKKQVWSIIIQDWAWVLASILVIVLQAWQLTSTGYWMIAVVALIVGDFAFFQMRWLRRLG